MCLSAVPSSCEQCWGCEEGGGSAAGTGRQFLTLHLTGGVTVRVLLALTAAACRSPENLVALMCLDKRERSRIFSVNPLITRPEAACGVQSQNLVNQAGISLPVAVVVLFQLLH